VAHPPESVDASPAAADAALVRAIGVWGLAASVINVTIGGGIFRLPASVATTLGPAAPLSYLVCAVAMGLIVLCLAEAGSRVSLTGGPYAYVETAFGPFVGFLAGVLLWLLGTLAVAAVSTVFLGNLRQLFPPLQDPRLNAAALVAIFAVLSAVNISGVRWGTLLNGVATVAKLLPLLLLVALGALAVNAEQLRWTRVPSPAEVSRTSILLIFAFSGVESALAPSGEVKHPARTVPRALLIAITTITLLYVALQVVAQGVLGPRLAQLQDAPLAEVAGVALGPWGRTLLLVGASVSMFGYVSGMTLAVPRALFAFGRDGLLPRVVAAVHPRFRTPYVAIAIQSSLVCGLALTSTFEYLAILANLATLVLYATCCVAAAELRRRDVRAGGIPFQLPTGRWIPIAAVLVIGYMLTSIRAGEWAALGIALTVASLIFVVSGRRKSAAARI
jgi:APA family basic amino acid/polyamine antiporter